ncbi:hypothetical protein GCM10018966_093700 [Streptomyces yanii]
MNGTVYLGFDSEDLSDWGRLLDAIEEAEQEADLDEPFTADWPRSGRTAYLRFISDDPYVVEVRDGTSTQIVVSAPLDMGEDEYDCKIAPSTYYAAKKRQAAPSARRVRDAALEALITEVYETDGKWPRARTALRIRALTFSIAFVEQMTLRIST